MPFFNLKKRCYDSWRGLPVSIPRLRPVVQCLRNELGCLTEMQYRIVELGPNGGRWTHTVLDIFKYCGLPVKLEYYLLGCQAEHYLTHRDAIQDSFGPTDPVPFNRVSRVRTGGGTTRLISEVMFIPIVSDWLKAVDDKGLSFTPRIDTFISFDSIKYLNDNRIIESLQSMKQCLVPGTGTIFVNIDNNRMSWFCDLYKKSGLIELIDPVSYDGHTYFGLRSL